MSILNQSHFEAVYQARQILQNIIRANPDSKHTVKRKHRLNKLKEVQDAVLLISAEPMFDELQNLDTGGPRSLRDRLGAHLYILDQELQHGNQSS